MSRVSLFGLSGALCVVLAACGQPGSNPVMPSALVPSSPVALPAADTTAVARPASATHGLPLTAVVGSGAGIVNVTPTAAVDGSFSAQINVALRDAPANTTFYVQRAPEIGRANGADGICQRAAGQAPWGPPAPNFVTFPQPATGPLVTLTTSAGGSGSVHIDFGAATIADGTEFDVMFRLVDDLSSPTNDLRTGCFTVTVK